MPHRHSPTVSTPRSSRQSSGIRLTSACKWTSDAPAAGVGTSLCLSRASASMAHGLPLAGGCCLPGALSMLVHGERALLSPLESFAIRLTSACRCARLATTADAGPFFCLPWAMGLRIVRPCCRPSATVARAASAQRERERLRPQGRSDLLLPHHLPAGHRGFAGPWPLLDHSRPPGCSQLTLCRRYPRWAEPFPRSGSPAPFGQIFLALQLAHSRAYAAVILACRYTSAPPGCPSLPTLPLGS